MSKLFEQNFPDSNEFTTYVVHIVSENGEKMKFDGVRDEYARKAFDSLMKQASPEEAGEILVVAESEAIDTVGRRMTPAGMMKAVLDHYGGARIQFDERKREFIIEMGEE